MGETAPEVFSPSIRVSTGVTRVVYGQVDASVDQPVSQQVRVRGERLVYNAGSGEGVQSTGRATYAVNTDGAAGDSITSTLRRDGPHMTVELEPGVPGSRTQIDVALREGLIRKNAMGLYEDVTPTTSGAAPLDDTEHLGRPHAAPDEPYFSRDEDAAWAQAVAPLSQGGHDAAVASSIAAIVQGSGLDQVALDLARRDPMEPSHAATLIAQGRSMFQAVADRALHDMGLEGDQLVLAYEHMRSQPQQLHDAVQKLVYRRDLSAFRELAIQYKTRAAEPVLSAMQKAGFDTYLDRDTGDVMVRGAQGGWQRARDVLKGAR